MGVETKIIPISLFVLGLCHKTTFCVMATKNCYIFLNLPIFQNEILFWTKTNKMIINDQVYSYDMLIDNTQENTDIILQIFYATDNPTVRVILVFLLLYLIWNKSWQEVHLSALKNDVCFCILQLENKHKSQIS